MRNKLIIFLFILLLPATFVSIAQKQINSPFSRFNLGSMEPSGSFKSQAMGGLGLSLRDNVNIFHLNPASYSSLDTNSFVFDFGLDYSMNRLSDGASSYTSDDMNFDHMIMGFPLSKKWGAAIGILPMSSGYFNLRENISDATGNYISSHKGNGGLSTLFAGTGVQLFKNFSAGINMNILFGQLDRQNDFIFEDVLNVYNNSSKEKLQLNGINFDYGVQYYTPVKKNYFFNAGLSFTAGKHYKSDYEKLIYRYTYFGTMDSISSIANKSGSLLIPGTVRAGISFGKINKFTAGIDFVITKWSKTSIPGSEGFTTDSKTLSFGIEYTPDKYSNFGILRRIDYRLGGHTGNNYLLLNGKAVKEAGLSAGFGIPMRRTFSKANFFADFTRRTASAASLKTENYITFGASINLYDFWFIKRKYD